MKGGGSARRPIRRLAFAVVSLGLAAAWWCSVARSADPGPSGARVRDATGTLTQGQAQALTARLETLEQRTGSQVDIVVAASTEPGSIEDFADNQAERCSPCTVIAVSTERQEVAVHVGGNLRAWLSRAAAARIAAESIEIPLKRGKVYEGLQQGLSLIELATRAPPQREQTELYPFDEAWLYALGAAGIVAGIVVRVSLRRHRFWSGALGLAGGGGMVAAAQAGFSDYLLGLPGAILLIVIAMGGGWFLLYLAFNLGLNLLLEGIGGGGGGGGFSGGGGGFGGGGASGSW